MKNLFKLSKYLQYHLKQKKKFLTNLFKLNIALLLAFIIKKKIRIFFF